MKIEIEVDYNGKVYKQPNCRLKLDCNGFVSTLIINDRGSWELVKGEVKNFNISGVGVTLCGCIEYEGTAEDGTCFYCRKTLRDKYE